MLYERLRNFKETLVVKIKGKEIILMVLSIGLLSLFWGIQIFRVALFEGERHNPKPGLEQVVVSAPLDFQNPAFYESERQDDEIYSYYQLKRSDPFQRPESEEEKVSGNKSGDSRLKQAEQLEEEIDESDEFEIDLADFVVPELPAGLSEEFEALLAELNAEKQGEVEPGKNPPEIDFTGLIRGPDQVCALFEYQGQVFIRGSGEEFPGGRVVVVEDDQLLIEVENEQFIFKIEE